VVCAAGYNIRWLLRIIVKTGIGLFLRLLQVAALEKSYFKCGRFL
jgi:IS5 family transposase